MNQNNLLQKKARQFQQKIRKQKIEEQILAKRLQNQRFNHPIIMIPILIQRYDIQGIQKILDFLSNNSSQLLIDLDYSFLNQVYEKCLNLQLKKAIFKIKNRLKVWNQDWYTQLFSFWWKENDMIKQAAYYFYHNKHSFKEKKHQFFFLQKFRKDFKLNQMVYYLEVLIPTIENFNQQSILQILPLLGYSLNNNDELVQLKTLMCLQRINYNAKISEELVKLQNFHIIIKNCEKTDLLLSTNSFQILVNILIGNDILIQKLIKQYQLIDILKYYLNHLFPGIRRKAYWGMSNIASTGTFSKDLLPLLKIIEVNFKKQQESAKIQIRYFLVNFFHQSSQQIFVKIIQQYQFAIQQLLQSLNEQKLDLVGTCLQSMILSLQKCYSLKNHYLKFGVINYLQTLTTHLNKKVNQLAQILLEEFSNNT